MTICDVSEDEPVPALLKKEKVITSNWDDEDVEDNDVKDSWEDDDEEPAPVYIGIPVYFGCCVNYLMKNDD